MCLYTRQKNAQVAKQDIRVLKYLNKIGTDSYESPCQHTSVAIGKVMTAKPDKPQLSEYDKDVWDNQVYALNGGAIHAKLSEDDSYGNCCKVAIIPKGTEYRTDPFGHEIAAAKMKITDEDGSNKSIGTAFWEDILDNAPEINGIRVGDYLLDSGGFQHPKKGRKRNHLVGIVVGFHDDQPLIAALDRFQEPFDTKYDSNIGSCTSDRDKAIKLFNGREVTQKYKEQYAGKDGNAERFRAFEACINYRKNKKEEWYYGAFGEVTTMLNNALYINAAWHITGIGFEMGGEWYSSCSEYSSSDSWGCYLGSCQVYCNWGNKDDRDRFVPFLAYSPKEKKKQLEVR